MCLPPAIRKGLVAYYAAAEAAARFLVQRATCAGDCVAAARFRAEAERHRADRERHAKPSDEET